MITFFALATGCNNKGKEIYSDKNEFGIKKKPFNFSPKTYILHHLSKAPVIDGKNTDSEWDSCQWTSDFVSEISGKNDNSSLSTKLKMGLFNDTIYLLAKLNESHIWGMDFPKGFPRIEDNYFQVCIDCNNNEHEYHTIKINALGITSCHHCNINDSLSSHPSCPFNNLNINASVYIEGTANNPKDIDRYWQAELAIPYKFKNTNRTYDYLKMNFTRNRWQYTIVDGMYKKILNSETGKTYEGEKWQWAYMWENPISDVELWGEVHPNKENLENKHFLMARTIKWELRNVYYAQKLHYEKHKRFAHKIAGLKDVGFDLSALKFRPDIKANKNHFTAIITNFDTKRIWIIDDSGRIKSETYKKR
ncbi:hypothetical protein [Plebeiibacterium marinum]|uniref:Uncharacterized protein n=1 Tax=Plebeiibacterium marinum TaxID=2992111 RepID=A0AAE3MDH6_9BACT|nr:hypothetical protein [Plebeiobacterium marinum]MCW3805441.1 hypothetical protein [Plebeiobacterium marinum]